MCLIILSIIGVVAVLQCLEQLGPFSCGSLIKRILADQISSVRQLFPVNYAREEITLMDAGALINQHGDRTKLKPHRAAPIQIVPLAHGPFTSSEEIRQAEFQDFYEDGGYRWLETAAPTTSDQKGREV
jgi:hypothetical protein